MAPISKCKTFFAESCSKLKTKQTSVLQYALPVEAFLPVNKFHKVGILLPFKYYAKRQNKYRFKQRLAISIYRKYKIISIDLKKRLYVNNPANDVVARTDIDKIFYKIIDGRQPRINVQTFTTLKKSINNLIKVKQEIGVKKDYDLQIEANCKNEMNVYDLSKKRLMEQAKYFDAFMSEDYQKSMLSLIQWDKLKCQIDSKTVELQNLAIEQFTLTSKLIGLEYQYSLQQKYGRFLYYLSPPLWRLNNRDFARSVDIEIKGFDFIDSNEEDTFTVIFERLQKICYEVKIKPVLYFTQPKDLMNVFDFLERQQLHYYTHVNHVAPQAKLLKSGIKLLKEIISQDYATVAGSIKNFDNLLSFFEERCDQLEAKFMKILYGLFYESVGTIDVLKLQLHLEFCYIKISLEKPTNTDIVSLAKFIEKFYIDYSKRLDCIQSGTVRRAMSKCMETEKLKVKRANDAAKELRLFHRLEHELLRAHGIYTNHTYRPVKKILKRHDNKIKYCKNNVEENKKRALTESEREYLLLFTDWTENEDPADYLLSLNYNENDEDNYDDK